MKRMTAWIVALTMPAIGLAAEPATDAAPSTTQSANDTVQTPNGGFAGPGRRCQAAAAGSTNTPGCFGGGRWGKGGPPYGAGYEARRQWQGNGSGAGRGMGRNGGGAAGCGR
jgi:hypothetical protein